MFGLLRLGMCLQDQPGRSTEAEEAFHSAVQHGEEFAATWLAFNLMDQGRDQEALDAFDLAIAQSDLNALKGKIPLLGQMGRLDEALQVAELHRTAAGV